MYIKNQLIYWAWYAT